MPRFLIEAAYTPEAWAALLENPTNRAEALKAVLDTCGARLETAFFAFGEYDIVAIIEAPDNASAAAISLAINSGGAVKACKTIPLMTMEEGMEAMRKGARARAVYVPPSKQLAGASKN
jgi:uncharacterized protein with GYD domain